MHRSIRRIILASIFFLLSLISGTIGFVVIEDYSLLDALYMSVITFSTVGFTEVIPLSDSGKAFTTVYIARLMTIYTVV
ncbi:MAG: ion channel, partial [Cyclobacteriaceae bacterium]